MCVIICVSNKKVYTHQLTFMFVSFKITVGIVNAPLVYVVSLQTLVISVHKSVGEHKS